MHEDHDLPIQMLLLAEPRWAHWYQLEVIAYAVEENRVFH
jgi:hypothetical protein